MSDPVAKKVREYDPAAELEKTKDLLKIEPEIRQCIIPQELNDEADRVIGEIFENNAIDIEAEEFDGFELTGKEKTPARFDAARHKANPDGSPKLGSKDQFLLRPEAKKTLKARAVEFGEKVKNAISLEKNDIPPEISEKTEIPLSDHELDKLQAQEAAKNAAEEAKKAEREAGAAARHSELTASAENGADMFFFGGSMVLGIEFLNQRDQYFEQVSKHIYEYEKKTGKSVDLPPGVALAFGLGRIGYEIAKTEPECKKRLDTGVAVIRKNATGYIAGKIPGFGVFKRSAPAVAPAGGDA